MMKKTQVLLTTAIGLLWLSLSPAAAHQTASAPSSGGGTMMEMHDHMMKMPGIERLMMPRMDPARGRKLFASKGCVACHAINGVGGHDAAPLDAHTMDRVMNPFEFAAKMWAMAPYMIAAQEEALGGQILFSGQELADIIAFVHDDEEQHKFSEADIPPEILPMMHHTHGAPGKAEAEHAEELGHTHAPGEEHGQEPHED